MINSDFLDDNELIRVLHVDDDINFLDISKEILQSENNFEIESVTNIDSALKLLSEKNFDIIVSDYQMPQKDGLQFLKILRENKNSISFILFTGKGREEIAVKALNLGANYYISKLGKPETVYGELAYSIKLLVERKKINFKLKQKSEILEQITENVGAGLAIIDRNYNIVWSNHLMESIVGPTQGKICYSTFNSLDHVCPDCGVKEIFGGKSIDVHEYHNVKNGVPFWIELIVTPLKNETGEIVAALELSVDITNRKKAQLKLIESEERFRQLFSMMPSGVAIYEAINDGSDFVFKDFNKAAELIEQVSRSNVIDRPVTEVFPGVKDLGLLDVLSRVYKTGKSEFLPTGFYSDKERFGWRENWIYKLPNNDVVAIYNDTSELKKNETKFRDLFENMYQGVFWQDSTGQLLDVNKAALNILGLEREEFLNRPSKSNEWKIIDEDGKQLTGDMHPSMVTLRTGKPIKNKMVGVFNPKRNDYVWVMVNVIPQFRGFEKSPSQVMVTFQDLNENKRSEMSLK